MKPNANDISICENKNCKNKCKRYCENWTPSPYWQSYVLIEDDGENCTCRME